MAVSTGRSDCAKLIGVNELPCAMVIDTSAGGRHCGELLHEEEIGLINIDNVM